MDGSWTIGTVVLGIACSLMAAAIVALVGQVKKAFQRGKADGKKEGLECARMIYEEQVKAASVEFADLLGGMIEKAYGKSHNPEVLARSIVDLRDGFANSLISLKEALNSQIDHLKSLLDELRQRGSDDERLEHEIQISIEVLHHTWPGKKRILQRNLDKLITEIGLAKLNIKD